MIGHDHPSFGTEQAWFMFAIRYNGSINRILLVNAKTPWAVQCMERILGEDQKVSATCECVSVFRDCSIGIRNDVIDEVPFQEFMEVMVDKKRLLDDGLAIEAFQNATITVKAPESSMRALPPPRKTTVVRSMITTVAEPVKKPEVKRKHGRGFSKVHGVLLGLGYKASQVDMALREMDVDFDTLSCDEAVHQALQKLAI